MNPRETLDPAWAPGNGGPPRKPRGVRGGLGALLVFVGCWMNRADAAEAPLRVSLIAGTGLSAAETREAMAGLGDFLSGTGGVTCSLAILADGPCGKEVAEALGTADAVVLWSRRRQLTEEGRAAIREFTGSGRGLVVLGAGTGAWADWPQFEAEILGARSAGFFAEGAPMRVIALFPHPILSGVDRLETSDAMLRIETAKDAQVIVEGTVAEETVPMGWVRRSAKGRIVCLEPAGRPLLGDPDYRRMISNGVRWAAFRPVPGARTVVERTIMPDALPGALAICFPQGPSLCFDTVRGGIDYVWDGDFVDLHPWWTAHHGQPLRAFAARFSGEIVYREDMRSPAMHVGTRSEQSAFHFRGYQLKADGNPVLFYTVGGREVSEGIYASGDGVGIVRAFHVASGSAPLWLKLDSGSAAEISVAGATRDGDLVRFDAGGGGDFTVTVRRGSGPSR